MAKAAANVRRTANLPEEPVEAFGTAMQILRDKGLKFVCQIQKNRARFKNPEWWPDAMVNKSGNFLIRVNGNKPRAKLVPV